MAKRTQQTQGPLLQQKSEPSPSGRAAFPFKLHLFDELKRRNVIRVAVLYLIACWVILEPTHVVFHMLEVPEWANRLVILLMVIGFPLVLLFSWVYEVTPEGLKPTAEVDPAKSITHKTGRKLNQAIIVVLSLAVIVLLADKFWLSKRCPLARLLPRRRDLPAARRRSSATSRSQYCRS